MSSNKGFTLEVKNNAGGYVQLYPWTTQGQVIAWNIGEVYGPYSLVIKATDWIDKKQIISFDGVSQNSVLSCVKVLSGTEAQMKTQDQNYTLLTSIQSAQNQIQFTCKEVPATDIQVQIWWTK